MRTFCTGHLIIGVLAWTYMILTRKRGLTDLGWDELPLIPELMILGLVAWPFVLVYEIFRRLVRELPSAAEMEENG